MTDGSADGPRRAQNASDPDGYHVAMIAPPEGAPRATALIALADMEGGAGEVPDPSGWEPFYGRPAEAQARWEIAHGRPLPDPAGGAR